MLLKKWLKNVLVIYVAATLLILATSILPFNQAYSQYVTGSAYANSEDAVGIKGLNITDHAGNNPEHSEEFNRLDNYISGSMGGKVDVIIGFKDEPFQGLMQGDKMALQRNMITTLSGEVDKEFNIINAVSAKLPVEAIESLYKRSEVSYIEPDYEISIVSQQVPWGIERVFGSQTYSFPTWDHAGGLGLAVAIVDTGIDENHVDLPELSGGINTIDSTHWGYDGNGHGTHVAGIVAALDNKIGVVGIAPGVDLYAVKVVDATGSGNYSTLIAGIEWAYSNNIPIINMSLGGAYHSEALENAVDVAYENGAILIAAAGNNGDGSDNVLYPARYSSVIAVSASDQNDKITDFSSRGPSIEFIAPGSDILSLYPDNYMVRFNGTSMAAPHMTGSAAVLWSANKSLNNSEVRELLRQSAQDLGMPLEHQGYGLVRIDKAMEKVIAALNKEEDDLLTETVSYILGLYDMKDGVFHIDGLEPVRFGIRDSLWHPIAGDWNGDNNAGVGLYDAENGVFNLFNENALRYGPVNSSWLPFIGDWAGDGPSTIGLYDPEDGVFHLFDEKPLRYGPRYSEWIPLSGDWNADGTSSVGLYDPSDGVFHLAGESPFRYGPRDSDWIPVASDWNGDGNYDVGLYDPTDGVFHLNGLESFRYGPRDSIWKPFAGVNN